MPYGWHEKLLVVDLGKGSCEYIDVEKELLKKYIGGRGIGAFYFLKYTQDPNVDPLGSQNPIILATGPLTATPSPTAGRISASFRSPLTMALTDTNLGGDFAFLLKTTGIDAIIIKGKAPEPVYIYLDDKQTKILPASHLWGKDNREVTSVLKRQHGEKASVLSIGRAGEKLVRFACVMNNSKRAFGRGGLGAVFGAKNLKAIVTVGGNKRPQIHSLADFQDFRYEVLKLLTTHPVTSKVLKPLGTPGFLKLINEFHILGTRNFTSNHFASADKLSGENLKRSYLIRNYGCWGCPIACGRIGKVGNEEGGGPEFETLYALGSNLGISDLEAVTLANFIANDLGMDTISLGGVIAFAMEATESGIYDFGIKFGETSKLVPLIEKIGLREDVGDMLAEGVKRVAEKVGGSDIAMHVKGMELPAYDPRGAQGMGLVYATSNRGACHLRGGLSVASEIFGVPRRINRFQSVGKGTHIARYQDSGAAIDSLIVCRFTAFATSLHHWVRVYNAVTGEGLTAAELQMIGERIFNLERIINLKLGFTKEHDTLPKRFLQEAIQIGACGEHVVDMDTMLSEYYEYRGWDENGVPTEEKIRELELEGDIPWL